MGIYDELYEEVKNTLSEKRFNHTLGVIKRAVEYAKIYNVNIKDVEIAALSHDIAKEKSFEESMKKAKELNIQLDEIEIKNFNLLHAKIGAEIIKNKYHFSDDIINAIKYHTTGREDMSLLEKIIFLADATEENRNYLELESLVNLIKEDINKGMIFTLKWTIDDLIQKEKIIHMDSIKAYNFLIST